jgi:hypothetical protein
MQGQAVTAADGVSLVGEVKTSGGFDCISLTFRNNWLLAHANPFFPIKAKDVKITSQNHTQIYAFVTPTNAHVTHRNVVLYWLLNVSALFAPPSGCMTPEVKTF